MCKKISYLNDYFVEIYDDKDNYITFFDNIKSTTIAFNMELKEVLRKIRENKPILKENKKYYLYLNPKELDYKDTICKKRN